MKTKLLILITVIGLLFSCENGELKTDNKNEIAEEKASTDDPLLNELKIEASRLRGGGSIKNVALVGEKANIIYVSNYKEYKKINPQSLLTEKELKSYWESGDAIEKALIDGSVRIMRKLNFVNEVDIILPYNENIYEISVKKSDLEQFVGADFKSITDNWDKSFSDPYVYDKKGRKLFFERFGVKK